MPTSIYGLPLRRPSIETSPEVSLPIVLLPESFKTGFIALPLAPSAPCIRVSPTAVPIIHQELFNIILPIVVKFIVLSPVVSGVLIASTSYHPIVEGSQVAIMGKAVNITKATSIIMKNGIAPRITSLMGRSRRRPCIT